jgi:hypothetical protein
MSACLESLAWGNSFEPDCPDRGSDPLHINTQQMRRGRACGACGARTLVYNISLDGGPGTPDTCIEVGDKDAIVVEFTLAQWLDPANQLQIENYFAHRARFAAGAGRGASGPAANFTFRFGSSTLTVPMTSRLVVSVDGYGIADEAN